MPKASDISALDTLKEQVLEATLELVRQGLVLFPFGNASGIDRHRGLVVIKPSGVDYSALAATDMVVTDLEGKIVEGKLRPSSDLATHLVLYRSFPQIGGVVHTHSRAATVWAQAGREIPCLGTTHADYFHGCIPVAGPLSEEEIRGEYELNTGLAIVRRFEGINPLSMPAVLVAGHAPFAWGKDAAGAAYNAVVLEEVAELAWRTMTLDPGAQPIARELLDKH